MKILFNTAERDESLERSCCSVELAMKCRQSHLEHVDKCLWKGIQSKLHLIEDWAEIRYQRSRRNVEIATHQESNTSNIQSVHGYIAAS